MTHWNWLQRSVANVLWPSFLAACVATLLFFAKVDATRLQQAFVFELDVSSHAIYSLGFMFFWFVCAISAGISTWLIRTERRIKDFPTANDDDASS